MALDVRFEAVEVALHRLAVHRNDDVTGTQAGQLRRAGLSAHRVDRLDLELVVVRQPHEGDQCPQEDEGHEEVHGRPGHGHEQSFREGLLSVGAGLVGRVHLLEIGHARDLHVAAAAARP